MPELDIQCPHCQTGLGRAQVVCTIPRRHHAIVVTMVCGSCGREWQIEREDPLLSQPSVQQTSP